MFRRCGSSNISRPAWCFVMIIWCSLKGPKDLIHICSIAGRRIRNFLSCLRDWVPEGIKEKMTDKAFQDRRVLMRHQGGRILPVKKPELGLLYSGERPHLRGSKKRNARLAFRNPQKYWDVVDCRLILQVKIVNNWVGSRAGHGARNSLNIGREAKDPALTARV